MIKYILLFILLILFLILCPNYISSNVVSNKYDFSLEKDGFEVFKLDTNRYTRNKAQTFREILNKLPDGYQFLDYEYKIVNSTLYTFHRDVTSSQRFQELSHPSYTLIIYLTDGKLLSICPGSYKQKYIISTPITISGTPGTAILFNADSVHAGAMNETSERVAIQYKICHKSDVNKIKHLNSQKIEKKEAIRTFSWVDKYLCRLSHKYIPLFDTNLGNIIERKTDNDFVNIVSQLINVDFYNKA